jgi:hypothetical protein
MKLVWHKTKKKLPRKGRIAVYVESSLSDVGIDIGVSNTDYLRAHPKVHSDWAYINYPRDFSRRKFKRLAEEFGAADAKKIMKGASHA